MAPAFEPARFRAFSRTALGMGVPTSRRQRLLLALLILTASFAVRSLYTVDLAPVMYSHRQPGTRMAGRYDEKAVSILRGEGILFPARRPDPSDTGILARPPGYAAFLAAIYAGLGRSFFAVQLVQNLLNSLSPILIFLIAGRVLSWRVGAVAGLLAAVSPHLAYASNLILPDALCALPLLLAVYLVTRAEPGRRNGLVLCAAAGAWIGLAAWLRPNVILLGPFLAVFLWVVADRRQQALARGAALTLASLALIAPITIRNYVLYGEFVPISINGGMTLWQGVAAAGGQRFGAAARDKMVIAEEATRHGEPRYEEWWAAPDGIRRDRERYRRALAVILSHPFWYAGAMLGRMAHMVHYTSGAAPLVRESATPPLIVTPPDATDLNEDAEEALVGPPPGGGSVKAEASRAEDPDLRPLLPDAVLLAPGEALAWTRPFVSAVQAVANATMLPLVLAGAVLLFALSWRGALFLLTVPFYYFLFQSMFILAWRVAVPMHYYLFVLAAVAWVLAWGAIRGGFGRLAGRRSSGAQRAPSAQNHAG